MVAQVTAAVPPVLPAGALGQAAAVVQGPVTNQSHARFLYLELIYIPACNIRHCLETRWREAGIIHLDGNFLILFIVGGKNVQVFPDDDDDI